MNRDTLAKHLLFSTFTNSAGKVIRLAIGFLLTPFVLHRLGATEYGMWMLVGSIVGYGSLLDFGMATAIVKYVAEHTAKGQLSSARGLVATALCLYVFLGLIAIAIGVAVAPFFDEWFNIPPEERGRAAAMVSIMTIGLGLAIPSAATSSVLAGLQRFDILNVLSVVTAVVSAIGTVVVLALGGGLLSVVVVTTATPALMQIPAILLVRHLAPDLHFGLRGADFRLVRQVVSYSSSVFMTDVAGCLLTRTDEIVIAAFLPVNAVSPFVIARRLGEVPQMLTDQFLRVMRPLAFDFEARGDIRRLRSLFLGGTRVTLALSLALGCPLVILAGPWLRVWVGPAYEPYGYLLIILAVSSIIDVSQWPAAFLLQSLGRHRPLAWVSLAVALGSVALSIALTPKFGLAGVALGTLIPCAAGSLAFTLPYLLRALSLSLREAAIVSYWPPAAAAIPAALFCVAFNYMLAPSSLIATAAVAALSVITYATAYLYIAASYPECALCRRLIGSRWTEYRAHGRLIPL